MVCVQEDARADIVDHDRQRTRVNYNVDSAFNSTATGAGNNNRDIHQSKIDKSDSSSVALMELC